VLCVVLSARCSVNGDHTDGCPCVSRTKSIIRYTCVSSTRRTHDERRMQQFTMECHKIFTRSFIKAYGVTMMSCVVMIIASTQYSHCRHCKCKCMHAELFPGRGATHPPSFHASGRTPEILECTSKKRANFLTSAATPRGWVSCFSPCVCVAPTSAEVRSPSVSLTSLLSSKPTSDARSIKRAACMHEQKQQCPQTHLACML
jgi:hypothetical protein